MNRKREVPVLCFCRVLSIVLEFVPLSESVLSPGLGYLAPF